MESKDIFLGEIEEHLDDEMVQLKFAKNLPYTLIRYIKCGHLIPLIGNHEKLNKDIIIAIKELHNSIEFRDCNRYIYFGQPTTEQLLDDFKQFKEIYAIIDYQDDLASKILYDEQFDNVLHRHQLYNSFTNLAMSIIHGYRNLNTGIVNSVKNAALNHIMSTNNANIAYQVFNGNTSLYLQSNAQYIDIESKCKFINFMHNSSASFVISLDSINGYEDITLSSYTAKDIIVQFVDGKVKLYPTNEKDFRTIISKYFDIVYQRGLEFTLKIENINSIEELITILNATYNKSADKIKFFDMHCNHSIKNLGLDQY